MLGLFDQIKFICSVRKVRIIVAAPEHPNSDAQTHMRTVFVINPSRNEHVQFIFMQTIWASLLNIWNGVDWHGAAKLIAV